MIGSLQLTLEYAKSHKFYSTLKLKGENIQEFPILTKKELFEKIENLISSETFLNVYWSPSGGTTSNDYVFMFPSDFQENKKQRNLFANQLQKLKILSNETIALNLFFGSGLYRSQEIFSDYVDICSGTVFPGGYTFTDSDAFELCKRFKVNTIMGYPSRIIKLAKYCQDNNLDLEIPNFIYGAEKLEPQKEFYIREILKVENIVGCYGSAESGVWAWTIGSNIYNYDPETMHIEIVDQTEDKIGSLIVTNLVRTKFPLIRYETGDLTIPMEYGQFQLVSRKSNSFSIGGSYFLLSNLEQDFNSSVLEYQIHLYVEKDSLLDVLNFKIVSNDEIKNKETVGTLEKLFGFLKLLIVLKIEFVGVQDLKKSKNAEKVVKIVDTRFS
jgi:phenylacetate-CoA ligase